MAELILPGCDEPFMAVEHTFHDAVPVVVQPSPFSVVTKELPVPHGATVADIVTLAGLPEASHGFVRVFVDDLEIPRASWHLMRPRVGRHVYIRVTPMGKEGGGKNILSSLLMLAVVVTGAIFAPMLAGALFPTLTGAGLTVATSLIGAGISLVGTMLISALIPPPGGELPTQRQLLTGVRNQFAPYATIPRHFGKRRVYPLQAARPYTEAHGKDRYLRVLLAVGQGPLRITEIKIGDTPIEVYDAVEVETREGWHADHAQFGAFPVGKIADTPQTLFTNTVTEDAFNVLLPDGGTVEGEWQTRVTDPNTSEISVDVTFPFGLAQFKNDGGTKDLTIEVDVQFRLVGDVAWTSANWAGHDDEDGTQTDGKLTCKDNSPSPTTRGGRWIVPTAGQYEVRLRRTTPLKTPENRYAQRTEWTALRSIKYENPVNQPGMALIAIRMKATDQLNGIPDTINCVVESYLPAFNGTSWAWEVSRNPGWAYADTMRRRATTRVIADSRIDAAAIRSWAIDCAATAPNAAEAYWEFNGTIEGGSIHAALRLIASHGRASFSVRDGRYSLTQDKAQTIPVQHITPRNSSGYSGTKGFVDLPHALKMQFINAANGYQEDEVIVYADGYSEANATKFESMELPACTSATQAWRDGRYFLAVGKLRPEEHTVMMDIEALRCTIGDYVMFAHDVLSIGVAYTRIAARVAGGGTTTGFILDTEVPREAGTSYVLRVRRDDGTSQVLPLVVKTGASDTTIEVELVTPIASSAAPAVGDLALYGETDLEAAPMMVKRIEPGPNLTAKLVLVDAQPGVWTADTGAIPPFNTYVTETDPITHKSPPLPSFTLVSDESVVEKKTDGTLQDRIAVSIDRLPSTKVSASHYEVQYRRTGSSDWLQALVSPVSVRKAYISTVRAGDEYDIRVRTISQYGATSAWVVQRGHIVIGKTTPPADVAGFTAEGRVDGVQLSWTPNVEIDVVSYTVKIGTSWDTAEVLTRNAKGNSLFVSLDVRTAQTFLIRAVDAIGLLSNTPAVAVASVTLPDDVAEFEAYPQDDAIRFKWSKVDGNSIRYEIRAGDAWSTGQRVAVSAANSTTIKLPVHLSGAKTFWIKALSAAGLYSAVAILTQVDQETIDNRNVIVTDDYSASDWAGTMSGMTLNGTGPTSFLTVDKAFDGLTLQRADYYRAVSLPASFYARTWLEFIMSATVNNTTTWEQATYSWEEATGISWAGTIDDSAGCEITPFIALADAAAVPGDLIEAFQLDGTTTGSNGTTPSASSGLSYATLHVGQGVNANAAGNLLYTMALPSVFTALWDFRFTADRGSYAPFMLGVLADPMTDPRSAAEQAGDFLIMKLNGAAFEMVAQHIAAAGVFRLTATGQPDMEFALPFEPADLLTFGIAQAAGERRFMGYNHRTGQRASVVIPQAPLGDLTGWRILAPSYPDAPGVLGNIDFRSTAMTVAKFGNTAPVRAPVGYRPFREFVPADYRFQDAIVWLAIRCDDRRLDIIMAEAVLSVDVPDVTQKGTVTLTTAALDITFAKPFYAAPSLQVTQTGGTTLAVCRITNLTETGFTARLFDASSPATAVAGTISYTATGY